MSSGVLGLMAASHGSEYGRQPEQVNMHFHAGSEALAKPSVSRIDGFRACTSVPTP